MSDKNTWNFLALVVGALAFYPQAAKVRRTGSTDGLSLLSFATLFVSLVLFAVFYALSDAPVAAVLACVQAAPLGYIVYYKWQSAR